MQHTEHWLTQLSTSMNDIASYWTLYHDNEPSQMQELLGNIYTFP